MGTIDEDKHVTAVNITAHRILYNAAERIETLAHISRMRIEIISVTIIETEHRLYRLRFIN